MMQDHTDLSERIANAEDWLARARWQLERGDRARGALTLLLAEAEVHHARELGMAPLPARPRFSWGHGAIGALAVAALIAGVWLSAPLPTASAPTADVRWPTIVALSDGTGSLLHLVQAPPSTVDSRVANDAGFKMRVPLPVVRSAAPQRPSVPAAPAVTVAAPAVTLQAPVVAAPAVPAQPAPVSAPAAVQQQPAPAVLSEADLIDLVLAAERSLRRSNQ